MKGATLICFLLFLTGVSFCLLELWFHLWDDETFIKLILTNAAFFAISFVWAFLVRENKESKKIQSGNGLD